MIGPESDVTLTAANAWMDRYTVGGGGAGLAMTMAKALPLPETWRMGPIEVTILFHCEIKRGIQVRMSLLQSYPPVHDGSCLQARQKPKLTRTIVYYKHACLTCSLSSVHVADHQKSHGRSLMSWVQCDVACQT